MCLAYSIYLAMNLNDHQLVITVRILMVMVMSYGLEDLEVDDTVL